MSKTVHIPDYGSVHPNDKKEFLKAVKKNGLNL